MSGEHEIIAANIRALRVARGWSVRRLAEECAERGNQSLTQGSLTNIERSLSGSDHGREGRRITVEELVFLAKLFDVTPNDLFAPSVPCPHCNGTGRIREDES